MAVNCAARDRQRAHSVFPHVAEGHHVNDGRPLSRHTVEKSVATSHGPDVSDTSNLAVFLTVLGRRLVNFSLVRSKPVDDAAGFIADSVGEACTARKQTRGCHHRKTNFHRITPHTRADCRPPSNDARVGLRAFDCLPRCLPRRVFPDLFAARNFQKVAAPQAQTQFADRRLSALPPKADRLKSISKTNV